MLLEECFLLDTVAALGKNDLLMTEVISERLFWHTSGGEICECRMQDASALFHGLTIALHKTSSARSTTGERHWLCVPGKTHKNRE